MPSYKKTFILIATLLFFTKLFSVELPREKPTIYWGNLNLPPGMCSETKTEYPCFVDQMVSQLQKQLKGYKHLEFKSSLKRLMLELKNPENLIVAPALAFSKERKEFIEFSYSSPFARLPYVLAINSFDIDKIQPYLDSRQNIDIEKLLKSPLRTIFYESRSYGEFLNPLINKYKSNHESIIKYSNVKGMRFLKLGRIDYLIIFPPHAKFAMEQLLNDPDFNIMTFPISGAPMYSVGRLGTSKTAQGKKLIGVINGLLYDDVIIKKTTKNYRDWLPNNLKEHYDYVSSVYQKDRIDIDAKNN